MTPFDYLLLRMELEGLRRLPGELIARTAPGMEDFPLVLVAHLSDGKTLKFFDNLLPARVRARLSSRKFASSRL